MSQHARVEIYPERISGSLMLTVCVLLAFACAVRSPREDYEKLQRLQSLLEPSPQLLSALRRLDLPGISALAPALETGTVARPQPLMQAQVPAVHRSSPQVPMVPRSTPQSAKPELHVAASVDAPESETPPLAMAALQPVDTERTRSWGMPPNSGASRVARQPDWKPAQVIAPQHRAHPGWGDLDALILEIRTSQPSVEGPWANATVLGLQQLKSLPFEASDRVVRVLERLEHLATVSHHDRAAAQYSLDEYRPIVAQMQYALYRRVVVWRTFLESSKTSQSRYVRRTAPDATVHSVGHVERCEARIRRVSDFLKSQDSGSTWYRYLEIDALQAWPDTVQQSPDLAIVLARRVVSRMESASLSDAQRAWMGRSPFRELADEFREVARQAISGPALLSLIYAFERDPSQDRSDLLAVAVDGLLLSKTSQEQQVGAQLDKLYRNANIRLTVGEELLNRMLPRTQVQREALRDYVLGAHVKGSSQTWTDLKLDLLPSKQACRLILHATGQVHSDTAGEKGPVFFRNHGTAGYTASKAIELTSQGLHFDAAESSVHGQTRLRNIISDYDGIPIVGWLVREMARREHAENQSFIRRRMETRVATQARERMDERLEERGRQMQGRMRRKVLVPLQRLDIEPVAHQLETTDDRLVMRYRVAGARQLAAFTPRPMALRGSDLSLQVHQSVLNNLVGQLELGGWDGSLRDLIGHVTSQLGLKTPELDADLPKEITVTLCDEDPIRFACHTDHLALRIHFAKLRVGRRVWRNFIVRANYRPDVSDQDAALVRDGIVRMSGRLGFRDQVAVRGIFTKVLSKNTRWPLFSQMWLEKYEISDLAVNQFIVRDGWLGLSIGQDVDLPPMMLAYPNCGRSRDIEAAARPARLAQPLPGGARRPTKQ